MERHRIPSVAQLRRELGHGDAFLHLSRLRSGAKVVRGVESESRGLTPSPHRHPEHLPSRSGEHSPLRDSSVVRWARRPELEHEPFGDRDPSPCGRGLSSPDAEAGVDLVDVLSFELGEFGAAAQCSLTKRCVAYCALPIRWWRGFHQRKSRAWSLPPSIAMARMSRWVG